ncbi:hypothetical protein KP78_17680 [Jeotgalibacillus soli]|uniref:Uncharacterized protein n=1 Tax=Jeotgalibacillus soli TaxID=889306 RepID=A0A0C2RA45_9BACL|nr:hypothetical protein KP78_17680 [Jeotgalibacillus soli]
MIGTEGARLLRTEAGSERLQRKSTHTFNKAINEKKRKEW